MKNNILHAKLIKLNSKIKLIIKCIYLKYINNFSIKNLNEKKIILSFLNFKESIRNKLKI